MNETNDDLRLRNVLREGRGHAPLPPRFQERVWQRIERAEQQTAITPARAISQWLTGLFVRPVFAMAWVTTLLVMGLGTGYLWGGHDAARSETQLSSHYVASINPYVAEGR